MNLVSGMRPTGKLHLGHYFGVIKNWIELEKDATEVYYLSADLHALSTSYEDKLNLNRLSIEMLKDWISCGIDASKANIFIQSDVSAHSELYLILNMITPVGWLQRNPSYKDLIDNLKGKDIATVGFLSYPVLQAVDVLLYDATHVPVGEDQAPHIELTREIARKFNSLYNTKTFTEPKTLLTKTAKLLGLDGRKMSKSYNNSIYLSDNSEDVKSKLKGALSDPQRVKKSDAGDPNICLVYDYHKLFSDNETVTDVFDGCTKATIGCIECKNRCANSVDRFLEPIRNKKESLSDKMIKEIISSGKKKATLTATNKLNLVKEMIFDK